MKTRYLSNNVFKRELRNGGCIKRERLLYSPSHGCLFCFVCRLFPQKNLPLLHQGLITGSTVELENGEEQ